MTGDDLGRGLALGRREMGELANVGDVADRVDVARRGLQAVVHDDLAAIPARDSHRFQPQAVG